VTAFMGTPVFARRSWCVLGAIDIPSRLRAASRVATGIHGRSGIVLTVSATINSSLNNVTELRTLGCRTGP